MSQFVKGAQDLRSLQKEKWAIGLFKGVTAQSYKTEVKEDDDAALHWSSWNSD